MAHLGVLTIGGARPPESLSSSGSVASYRSGRTTTHAPPLLNAFLPSPRVIFLGFPKSSGGICVCLFSRPLTHEAVSASPSLARPFSDLPSCSRSCLRCSASESFVPWRSTVSRRSRPVGARSFPLCFRPSLLASSWRLPPFRPAGSIAATPSFVFLLRIARHVALPEVATPACRPLARTFPCFVVLYRTNRVSQCRHGLSSSVPPRRRWFSSFHPSL